MNVHKPTFEKSIFKATFLILIAHQLFKLAGLIQANSMGRKLQSTLLYLVPYTFALPAAAIETIVMQAFFANRRMITVTLIGIVFSSLSMAVIWFGIRYFGGLYLAAAYGLRIGEMHEVFCLVRNKLRKRA